MPTTWSRRGFLTALTAGAAAAAAAACGSSPPGTIAKDGSITVRHAFGETRIPAPPQRVLSAGLTGQDCLLAVGTVPIAVTEWFGAQPFAVWPWAGPDLVAALALAQPTVLSLTDGIDLKAITALHPDLIVATDAGLDQDTYTKLSEVAPTIAQSGQDAFFEPWKDQAAIIGEAVFKHREMQQLITDIDARFSAAGTDQPQFSGKRVLLLQGSPDPDGLLATPPGWRTEFLSQMGFDVAATDKLIPHARVADVLADADVLIWTTDTPEAEAALLTDPVIANRGRRNVFTGPELAAAIAFSSPLSLPVVADRLPPMLAVALT